MGYGTGGITKLEYAACLAAAIALAGLRSARRRRLDDVRRKDRDARCRRAPGRGSCTHILIALERLKAGAKSDVAKPLHQLADTLTKRGLIVLISDLLDEPEAVVTGLRYLRARGMEVVVFHVLDQAELTFPFEEAAKFTDVEIVRRDHRGARHGARALSRRD